MWDVRDILESQIIFAFCLHNLKNVMITYFNGKYYGNDGLAGGNGNPIRICYVCSAYKHPNGNIKQIVFVCICVPECCHSRKMSS